MKRSLPWLLLLLVATPVLSASLVDRLKDEDYLQKVRRDARKLGKAAAPEEKSGEFLDLRAVMHAHSSLSHDSRGTHAEILAAAKATGTRAVFMAEHPTPDRKWLTEGLQGEKEGVLFVPGAELSDGLLLWRGHDAAWTPGMKAGPVLETLQNTDGVAFVAHPEERKQEADWELPSFQGMEIYNTHADAMDSGYEKMLEDLRKENPFKILQTLGTVKKYTQECFGALFYEQTEILKRWDSLNTRYLPSGRRVVGIAGNDSHQNVGVSFAVQDENLIIKDGLGKVVGMVPSTRIPVFLLGGFAANPENLTYSFDPYEVSFRYVGTHLLATEATENALFQALTAGRAYVSFDWLANPSGFRYFATGTDGTIEMGGAVKAANQATLTVRPNMSCQIRLLRSGVEVARVEGAELTHAAREPGIYRAECWVQIAGESRPWIYSNPIYVTAQ